MYNIIYETSRQSRFDARYWMLGPGAMGQPRGMGWGGRREEGSEWGTRVYLWRIHVDIQQNQYNIVKLKKKIHLSWPSPGVMGSMVRLMANSKKVYVKGTFQYLSLCVEPLPTHSSTGGPPTLAGSFGSASCGVTTPFLWVLVCAQFCLCLPSRTGVSVSLSPLEGL